MNGGNMYSAGDLCSLSWSSLKQDDPKKDWFTFDLSGHKTDYFMIDDPTPTIKGEKKYCPSFSNDIRMVSHLKSANSPLFSWSDDLYLDTIELSNILKSAMASIGISHISGHSLRIGAATELASKGVSDTIIETAGNWAPGSRSRKRYQRRIGLAANDLTTTLLD